MDFVFEQENCIDWFLASIAAVVNSSDVLIPILLSALFLLSLTHGVLKFHEVCMSESVLPGLSWPKML